MNTGKIQSALVLTSVVCSFITLTASNALADVSTKQARSAITRMPGFELKNSSVRVKSVTASSAGAAEVVADIKTVLKFEQDKDGRWRIAEIRTGQDRWEDISVIAEALHRQIGPDTCQAPDPPARGRSVTDPSFKRARCLIASLLSVEMPSDEVRIQDITPMAVPFASQGSATVVAWVRTNARLLNDKKGWHVSELRTGSGDWVQLEPILAAVNERKQQIARSEMELIARALEKFRQERGFYVVSDSQAVAIDHLSPRYLVRVIRLDPWHQPYKYVGDRDHFTLRSAGPDGKADTGDDIQLSGPSR